jgi:chorismate mutase-like protein
MLQNKSLDALRAKIDQIDDAVHDLLVHRAEVTRAIAQTKQPAVERGRGLAMRPAREAQILRRLLARHRGELPETFILRIWREIIAASLQLQTPFRIHVPSGGKANLAELARAHFGALAPLSAEESALSVVRACAADTSALGVVPPPRKEESGTPWWALLAPTGEKGPRIIAKLPFVADRDAPAAYAIASVEHEETGDDTTLLRLDTEESFRRAALTAALKGTDFDAEVIARGAEQGGKRGHLLLAARGFVGAGDSRLQRLRGAMGDSAKLAPVGGFANPIAGSTAR